MRVVVAVVLLLIQLRPLAGAVVCLEQSMADQECAMPEHGLRVTEASESKQSVPVGCQATALCGPAGLAIPQTEIRFSLVQTPLASRVGLDPAHRGGPALAPPFHPPRV